MMWTWCRLRLVLTGDLERRCRQRKDARDAIDGEVPTNTTGLQGHTKRDFTRFLLAEHQDGKQSLFPPPYSLLRLWPARMSDSSFS